VNCFVFGHGCIVGGAEGRGEEARYDVDEAGSASFGAHAGHGIVRHLVTGTTQSSADDAHGIARTDPTAREALSKGEHVLVAEGGLEFGKRAERQAKAERLPIEDSIDLAAVQVGHVASFMVR
jgi:hypothetical protein